MALKEFPENHVGDEPDIPFRGSFEIFKSNICHMVKDKGDMDFIIDVLRGSVHISGFSIRILHENTR